MDNVALVTGADRGLGLCLASSLLEKGWRVLAGRHLDWQELDDLSRLFPETLMLLPLDVSSDSSVAGAAASAAQWVDHVDLLIANAAINRSAHLNGIREGLVYEDILSEYSVNAVGPLRVVKAFLPLLDRGLKRLCFVSSEAGSIADTERTGWFGYCMSKAALNMAVKNLSNDLSSQGYAFRLYHPGWLRTYMSGKKNLEAPLEPEEGARLALDYFLDDSVSSELKLHAWDGQDLPW